MPNEQTMEGFIIKQQDLGEADSILTFFSKEQGKIRAVVKSAKRMTSKLQGRLQPYNQNSITVVGKSALATIIGVQPVQQFAGLLQDESTAYAAVAVQELLQRALPDGEPNPVLYSLTEEFYSLLHNAHAANRDRIRGSLLHFYILALAALGLAPKLITDTALPETVYFSMEDGGFILTPSSVTALPVSAESYVLYERLLNSPIVLPDTFSDLSLFRIISEFTGYQIDRELQTSRFFYN